MRRIAQPSAVAHRAIAAAGGALTEDSLSIPWNRRNVRGTAITLAYGRGHDHTPHPFLIMLMVRCRRCNRRGGRDRVTHARPNATVVEGAVKAHLENILQKLDVKDRTEAVMMALRRGFIRLD